MKEEFIPRKFAAASLALIARANTVIERYQGMGYRLTLRQLYYQLVAADLIPNNIKSYKNLASLINDARLAGKVDWEAIEDRGRETVTPNVWSSPSQILRVVAGQYREDLWIGQPWHIEVMAEKDAVSNVIEPVCDELGVRFTANRGYPSASLLKDIAERVEDAVENRHEIAFLYFGDHDPSGLDMDRDVLARVGLLSHETEIDFRRIALTWDQIETWNPPPNPAKQTDSRFEAYAAEHGDESWELDAVKAEDLADLVRTNIEQFISWDTWDEAKERQDRRKEKLAKTIDRTIDKD
jgi:hypothetical protein